MKPFTQRENDFVQNLLTTVMKSAQAEENMEVFNEAAALSSKIEQYQMHGEGMSSSLRKRFEKRMTVAQQNGDQGAAMKTLRDMMAALMRIEPDPAKQVANMCMSAIAKANFANAAAVFIPLMQRKISGLHRVYQQEGYPDAQMVLGYLSDWLTYGQECLSNGEDPWPDDEDLVGGEEPS